jgi:hypothetical protein
MTVIFGVGSGQGEDMPHQCLQPGMATLTNIKFQYQPHNAGIAG